MEIVILTEEYVVDTNYSHLPHLLAGPFPGDD